jgi:hypothetical protein
LHANAATSSWPLPTALRKSSRRADDAACHQSSTVIIDSQVQQNRSAAGLAIVASTASIAMSR